MSEKECLFEKYGLQSKKVIYIPIKDRNGVNIDKCLRVVVGSSLYKRILDMNVSWIIEDDVAI